MALGRVVVVGLGPGDPALIGAGVAEAVARIPVPFRFVRTSRHPTAGAVPGATSFDQVYDEAASLDEVYPAIVERLVAACGVSGGAVLYAVPGSPLVAERTVELLRADPRVDTEVVPALSFLDLAWERLGVDPLAAGVRLVDGQRFAIDAAGQTGPLLVAQCDTRRVLSEVKLAVDDGPDVVVLSRLGLPDESVRTVAWADLDRDVEPDHLTTLWIPRLAAPVAAELSRFVELVRTLRERCPWDQEQTHRSLTRHLLEETYEVLEAIDELPTEGLSGALVSDGGAGGITHLEEELGDLLFQVVFHATLAAEEGWFDLADVARGIHDKLVGRHPHVFGSVEATTPDAVVANWEEIKRAEKGRTRILEGVPGNLPALLYAHKLQRKAASAGFDWDDVSGALAKVREELGELESEVFAPDAAGAGAAAPEAARAQPPAQRAARAQHSAQRAARAQHSAQRAARAQHSAQRAARAQAEELGDLLFSVVNVARHLDIDPESVLRDASAKFRKRVDAVEALAAGRGVALTDLDLAGLDALWEEVKARPH